VPAPVDEPVVPEVKEINVPSLSIIEWERKLMSLGDYCKKGMAENTPEP